MSHDFKRTKEKNLIHYILKTIEVVLTLIIILISLIIVVQRFSNNEKAFMGYRMFRVQTGSMIPKYNIGDVLLVKEKDINKIEVGDDLVYNGISGDIKGMVVTHQIVRKEEQDGQTIFYTKGIANTIEDKAPVIESQINGTVLTKLHSVTFITSMLSNKYVVYFAIILPLTIYIFFTVVSQKLKRIDEIERNTKNNGSKKED